jgi:exosortase K
MNNRIKWSAQLLLVLLCVLGLKFHYSTASVDELRWILAPTTTLVELFSDRSFAFESYAGYMSSDRTFVIAAPCAGVNFLIAAFLMLSLKRLWRERFRGTSWSFLLLAGAGAFLATLIANTVRIWIALEMQSVKTSWLTANQVHRVQGIVVYFGFLLLLFVISERLEAPRRSRRLLVFPLAVYYGATLGIPLLNGSYRQGFAFLEHSFFVLVLPLLLMLPVVHVHKLHWLNQKSAGVSGTGCSVGDVTQVD